MRPTWTIEWEIIWDETGTHKVIKWLSAERWPGEKEKLEVEGLGNFGCTRIPMQDNHRVDGKVPAQS